MSQAAVSTQMLDLTGLDVTSAVNRIVSHAVRMNASDLYLLTNESFLSIQVRHLGVVRPIGIASIDQGRRYLSHIKAAAGMDLNEKRRPLDGRWIHQLDEETQIDLRINSIPTLYGEDFSIRLLVREQQMFDIEQLGMMPQQYRLFANMLESPGGLILITGPTGSGKTATLYASLNKLNDGTRKVNTIEDPIEFHVEGIRQSQINPVLNLGFSDLLRSVLRQAPDIIMVGEIRDSETAETAVRAANSGHLVFSTLHAPVAAGAIQSMRSLGVHAHFLSTSLRGIASQRLVRTLCRRCRLEFDISHAPETFSEIQQFLGPDEGKTLYAPKGCEACNYTGYASRTAVFEVMDINRELRNQISDATPTAAIRDRALELGMIEFRQAALMKVAQGATSTEEVFRVIPSEYLLVDD